MIQPSEFRIGNYMLFKASVRILPTPCTLEHFKLMAEGKAKDMFAIPFKPDTLQKIGFVENKKYYQYPEGREFILTLPVMGVNTHEIRAYINSKNESYARAVVNEIVITNNFYFVHQLQNVHYALTGEELSFQL